jgi:uncharacterized protein (TIGR02596 family)
MRSSPLPPDRKIKSCLANFKSPDVSCKAGNGGFTLIELLLVISIIVLIAGLVIPAAGPMLKGSQLTQSGTVLSDQLSLARQRALTKNRAVEVRFYRYGDPEFPGEKNGDPSSGHYRAMQCFEVLPSGSKVPMDKVQYLQPSIIADSSVKLSTLLNQPTRPEQSGASGTPRPPAIPRGGNSYKFVSFQFRPDGATDLPLTGDPEHGKWFLTLHSINDGDGRDTPPANFYTLQIDPANGKVRSFRP